MTRAGKCSIRRTPYPGTVLPTRTPHVGWYKSWIWSVSEKAKSCQFLRVSTWPIRRPPNIWNKRTDSSVCLLSQVTQKATLQQGSTKAEFLQVRQFFLTLATNHIFYSGQKFKEIMKEKLYEASGSPYWPEYIKIRCMKTMLLVRKYLGRLCKGKKTMELQFQYTVGRGYNVMNEFCVVINKEYRIMINTQNIWRYRRGVA